MKLIVVIPAYNEEDTIADIVKDIPKKFKGIKDVVKLVIDDGSTDKTVELARQAGALVVGHVHNRGVGGAFLTGLIKALEMGADIMVNIDADGQFSPKDINLLIAPILSNQADFVSGDRFTDEKGNIHKPQHMSSIKFWGNQRMSQLINFLSNNKINDVSCGFRAYSKEALLRLNLTGKFTYTQESFLDLAAKDIEIMSIPVKVKYFPERKSRLANNIYKYMIQTVKIILRAYRDYNPLRFFGWLGMIPFIIGSGCGLLLLIHYIYTGSFTPYKVVGFVGIYLVSLGMLLWIVGLLADMFVRVRLYQEQILYYEKQHQYGKLKNRRQ
jgi:glycosyltransferase involved in cell wall biosynthesis